MITTFNFFKETNPNKLMDEINAESVKDLLGIDTRVIDTIIKSVGENVYGATILLISKKNQVSNNWNAWFNSVGFDRNGDFYMGFYVQGDNTDDEAEIYLSDFINHKTFKSGGHGFRFSFIDEQRAACIRAILKEYVRIKFFDAERIAKQKKFEELTHWEIMNPVTDEIYDQVGYNAFDGKNPRYKAYCKAKKELEQYISDNVENLYGKTKEELQKIYLEVMSKSYENNLNE